MGTLFVDKLDPQSGTSLEIGSSGDTITIPSGATITNSGTANGFGDTVVAGTERFKVVLSSNQSPSEGVWTKVQYDTEIFDSGNNFSSYKYTAPATGTYLFNITLACATDGSYGIANSMAQLYKNGSLISGQNSIFGLPTHLDSNGFDTGSIGWTVYVNAAASDYFEVYGRINRNGNATTQNFYSDSSRRTEWSGFRVT
tara:strand:+ start:174 stop:770 length:597 start_codon:yes stop_codon:yes gene_type:complete